MVSCLINRTEPLDSIVYTLVLDSECNSSRFFLHTVYYCAHSLVIPFNKRYHVFAQHFIHHKTCDVTGKGQLVLSAFEANLGFMHQSTKCCATGTCGTEMRDLLHEQVKPYSCAAGR